MQIMVCLPGRSYSNTFLTRWTDLVCSFYAKGIQFAYTNAHITGMYEVRNLCLSLKPWDTVSPLPFQGRIPYDYILWIDSDIIFKVEQVHSLLSQAVEQQLPILSGIYRIETLPDAYTAVEQYDLEMMNAKGGFPFMTAARAKEVNGICKVMHSNLGFTLVKYGIFEKMVYPWFRPEPIKFGEYQFYSTEDTYFATKARELGFLSYVDTRIIVGHEKSTVLY